MSGQQASGGHVFEPGRIFISGPMGSGKSTVARRLAGRLGCPWIDLDQVIEEREGASVRDIFATRGERHFRSLERSESLRIAERPGPYVVSLGGGTAVDRRVRRRLIEHGFVVSLQASIETLLERTQSEETRPLLAVSDAALVLRELLEERDEAYAECHLQVETDGLDREAVVERILLELQHAPILVPLGRRSYRVFVAAGARHRLRERIPALKGVRHVIVVTDTNLSGSWAADVAAQFETNEGPASVQLQQVVLEPGESHKNLQSVERIWTTALGASRDTVGGGLDRSSVIVGVGGGVVGDLAGFAAATLLRGIPLVHVPTSLLAMVDSAIGGKTGFDTEHGKNLIGAFHQPLGVLIDPEALRTLPPAELRSGLAEVIKSAWLAGEAQVAALEADADRLKQGDVEALARAIHMAATLKAQVVAQDELESRQRMLLNLGHTVGHAIEAAAGFGGVRHGEAVGLGMLAAFRVASGLGHPVSEAAARMRTLLERVGLPTNLDEYLDPGLQRFFETDKKRRGDRVSFVVPSTPGQTALESIPLSDLQALLLPLH